MKLYFNWAILQLTSKNSVPSHNIQQCLKLNFINNLSLPSPPQTIKSRGRGCGQKPPMLFLKMSCFCFHCMYLYDYAFECLPAEAGWHMINTQLSAVSPRGIVFCNRVSGSSQIDFTRLENLDQGDTSQLEWFTPY